MAAELSKAEQVFALRMLPHLSAGKSFEDAARAVLDDDARIFAAFCDRRHGYIVPTADERGRPAETSLGQGDLIASEITQTVYEQLRSAA